MNHYESLIVNSSSAIIMNLNEPLLVVNHQRPHPAPNSRLPAAGAGMVGAMPRPAATWRLRPCPGDATAGAPGHRKPCNRNQQPVLPGMLLMFMVWICINIFMYNVYDCTIYACIAVYYCCWLLVNIRPNREATEGQLLAV